MVFFQVLRFLTCVVEQFFMTQLTSVYAKFLKKHYRFAIVLNLELFNLLHITDDSRMKDVLQLTTEIVVASSTKKKLKKLKNIQKVVF